MDNCQCQGIELETRNWVERNVEKYRAGTPASTTALLLDALSGYELADRDLLDIGGGIGIIQLELLKQGLTHATSIEASSAYLQAAQAEAERAGMADRITTVHGNFVDLAESAPQADIVTLDRVICCFDDAHNLVARSVDKAGWLYGVTYPTDSLWNRLASVFENLFLILKRSPFRVFIHPTRLVDDLTAQAGFVQVSRRTVFEWPNTWQIVVYERQAM